MIAIVEGVVQPTHWWVIPAVITWLCIGVVVHQPGKGHPVVATLVNSISLNIALSVSLIAWIIAGFLK